MLVLIPVGLVLIRDAGPSPNQTVLKFLLIGTLGGFGAIIYRLSPNRIPGVVPATFRPEESELKYRRISTRSSAIAVIAIAAAAFLHVGKLYGRVSIPRDSEWFWTLTGTAVISFPFIAFGQLRERRRVLLFFSGNEMHFFTRSGRWIEKRDITGARVRLMENSKQTAAYRVDFALSSEPLRVVVDSMHAEKFEALLRTGAGD